MLLELCLIQARHISPILLRGLPLLFLLSCVTKLPSYHLLSQPELASRISPYHSFDTYLHMSGEWLKVGPILVNSDFDFALGFSLDEGPSLATAKRIKDNKEMAALLNETQVVPMTTYFEQAKALSPEYSNLDQYQGDIVIYALLYGKPKAHMYVVFEQSHHRNPPSSEGPADLTASPVLDFRGIYVTAWRPLEGTGSWKEHRGQAITVEIQKSMPILLDLWASYGKKPPAVSDRKLMKTTYQISNQPPIRADVFVLNAAHQDFVIFTLADKPGTVVHHPRMNLSLEALPSVKANSG